MSGTGIMSRSISISSDNVNLLIGQMYGMNEVFPEEAPAAHLTENQDDNYTLLTQETYQQLQSSTPLVKPPRKQNSDRPPVASEAAQSSPECIEMVISQVSF